MARHGMIVRAPFDEEVVASLAAYQADDRFHPYTCGNRGDGNHPEDAVLTPTAVGLTCPFCAYVQTWAHGSHADYNARWPGGSEVEVG